MKRFLGFCLRMIGILSLAFLLAGCVIARYYEGPKIPEEKLKEIKPGVTTKAEILNWFGPLRIISVPLFSMRSFAKWI
jgi:hypothetical protein